MDWRQLDEYFDEKLKQTLAFKPSSRDVGEKEVPEDSDVARQMYSSLCENDHGKIHHSFINVIERIPQSRIHFTKSWSSPDKREYSEEPKIEKKKRTRMCSADDILAQRGI